MENYDEKENKDQIEPQQTIKGKTAFYCQIEPELMLKIKNSGVKREKLLEMGYDSIQERKQWNILHEESKETDKKQSLAIQTLQQKLLEQNDKIDKLKGEME